MEKRGMGLMKEKCSVCRRVEKDMRVNIRSTYLWPYGCWKAEGYLLCKNCMREMMKWLGEEKEVDKCQRCGKDLVWEFNAVVYVSKEGHGMTACLCLKCNEEFMKKVRGREGWEED